jgi:nucleotide-binding universal stress UspA family protein
VFHPRVILHPTDFSDCSTNAGQIATDLARQNEAALVILHVAETLGPENVTYGEAGTRLQPEGYRQRLEEELRQYMPAAAGLPVRYVLRQGDAPEQIERVAREEHCDLIVIGTHGHSGLTRLLLGSITDQVIRRARCPVLVAKLPQSPSP